jgi:hypothetical protein
MGNPDSHALPVHHATTRHTFSSSSSGSLRHGAGQAESKTVNSNAKSLASASLVYSRPPFGTSTRLVYCIWRDFHKNRLAVHQPDFARLRNY